MYTLLQVTSLAFAVLILSTVLKKVLPEMALLLCLLGGISIIYLVFQGFQEVFDMISYLAEVSGMEEVYLVPVLKTVVISVVTKLSCELCRSGGEGGLASFVEFAGVVLALLVAIPLMEGVMTMMVGML